MTPWTGSVSRPSPVGGYAPYARSPAPVLQIPGRHRLRGREVDIVTPGLVRRAHALGKQIHVWFHPWAPQDDAEMHRLLDLGVDGLVVDDLETLRRVYAERGHPLP